MTAFLADQRGDNTVEMALSLMVVVILTLGACDLALALWQWNQAEKATHLGARRAIVSDFVAPQLAGWQGPTATVKYGTPCWDGNTDICALAPNPLTCTQSGCDGQAIDQTAFDLIVADMQRVYPPIRPENVEIQYTFNGLGFVGRPGGLPVDVTIRLTGMTFGFIVLDSLVGLPSQITMPPFAATLVGEDFNSSL